MNSDTNRNDHGNLPLSRLRSTRSNFVEGGLYGGLEPFFQGFRASAPMDLQAKRWREEHPGGTFEEWRQTAKTFLLDSLHYHPGPVDLRAETLSVEQRDGYRAEFVHFNTAPWARVEGWLLCPDGPGPFPAMVVLHSWGGPLILGKDRVVSRGKSHPALDAFVERAGGFTGDQLARRGYAVIAIDAHHFGSRLPWGAKLIQNGDHPRLPERVDPLTLSETEFAELNEKAVDILAVSAARYIGWAGTTWAGINFWDDSRCIDYLVSRPEVDASRIGCVGQSVGGWRSHVLAGLDERVAASISSCWTTTGDWNHLYSCTGTIGPYTNLPGVWRRMDVPDLALLSAPRAKMIISGQLDHLFTPEAMEDAAQQVAAGYVWAQAPERFKFHYPEKGHLFDQENKAVAWEWLDRMLDLGKC